MTLHFLGMTTAIWPISTETFFSDHRVFKFMFYSCLAAKMSTLAGFCSLTEYLYIYRRLYNEATEKCTYPAWQPAPRQSTALPKILPALPRWQVNQLYLPVFLSIALPKICAAVGIIMGRPRAFMEQNNRCAAHWENPLLLCQHVRQL